MSKIRLTTLLFAVFLFIGCDRDGPDAVDSANSDERGSGEAGTINWFAGSVEDAFVYAGDNNKPLFLYWGAVWCPPCEEINQTVFKDPGFIAQSELFVPVYLDGDTGRAQTWGEHFAVQGYPTMIIFNAVGDEVTRIPGAIEVERYNSVLELTLNGLKRTSELVEQALVSPDQLSREDFTQLAYYSWDQENLDLNAEPDPDLLKTLSAAARDSGNQIAATRLYLQSLTMAYSREQRLTPDEMLEAQGELETMLSNQDLVLANFDFSMFWSKELMELITEPGEGRENLSNRWAQSMQAVHEHPSLSKAEQLGSWYPQLHLYWLNNPDAQSLPTEALDEVRAHVAEMDRDTRGSARQTVINKAYQVLQAARLYDESREILLAEIEKSESPYYFMSGLASLAEQQKDFAAASDWLERAYANAEGKATRFQWGVEYVTGLIRMQPEEHEKIITTVAGLLDNLEQDQDVFAGRNFGRLQTLQGALKDWDGGEQPALASFYARLGAACQQLDRESMGYRNCSTAGF
ncbi:MAG: thioredoxin family protein [Cellvibrionaceae bacterium]